MPDDQSYTENIMSRREVLKLAHLLTQQNKSILLDAIPYYFVAISKKFAQEKGVTLSEATARILTYINKETQLCRVATEEHESSDKNHKIECLTCHKDFIVSKEEAPVMCPWCLIGATGPLANDNDEGAGHA